MVCMRVSVRDAHTMDWAPQGPAKWSAAIVKRWVKRSLLGPNRLAASGQRERHDVVAERRSQSPVAPGGDDDVLLATGRQLIGHRGRLAAGRQRGAPQLLPILEIEGAEAVVEGGGNEHQAAGGHNGTAQGHRAPFGGVGSLGRERGDRAERHFPAYGAGLQVHGDERAPGRASAGKPAGRDERPVGEPVGRAALLGELVPVVAAQQRHAIGRDELRPKGEAVDRRHDQALVTLYRDATPVRPSDRPGIDHAAAQARWREDAVVTQVLEPVPAERKVLWGRAPRVRGADNVLIEWRRPNGERLGGPRRLAGHVAVRDGSFLYREERRAGLTREDEDMPHL